jgi:hypothetical protein
VLLLLGRRATPLKRSGSYCGKPQRFREIGAWPR